MKLYLILVVLLSVSCSGLRKNVKTKSELCIEKTDKEVTSALSSTDIENRNPMLYYETTVCFFFKEQYLKSSFFLKRMSNLQMSGTEKFYYHRLGLLIADKLDRVDRINFHLKQIAELSDAEWAIYKIAMNNRYFNHEKNIKPMRMLNSNDDKVIVLGWHNLLLGKIEEVEKLLDELELESRESLKLRVNLALVKGDMGDAEDFIEDLEDYDLNDNEKSFVDRVKKLF